MSTLEQVPTEVVVADEPTVNILALAANQSNRFMSFRRKRGVVDTPVVVQAAAAAADDENTTPPAEKTSVKSLVDMSFEPATPKRMAFGERSVNAATEATTEVKKTTAVVEELESVVVEEPTTVVETEAPVVVSNIIGHKLKKNNKTNNTNNNTKKKTMKKKKKKKRHRHRRSMSCGKFEFRKATTTKKSSPVDLSRLMRGTVASTKKGRAKAPAPRRRPQFGAAATTQKRGGHSKKRSMTVEDMDPVALSKLQPLIRNVHHEKTVFKPFQLSVPRARLRKKSAEEPEVIDSSRMIDCIGSTKFKGGGYTPKMNWIKQQSTKRKQELIQREAAAKAVRAARKRAETKALAEVELTRMLQEREQKRAREALLAAAEAKKQAAIAALTSKLMGELDLIQLTLKQEQEQKLQDAKLQAEQQAQQRREAAQAHIVEQVQNITLQINSPNDLRSLTEDAANIGGSVLIKLHKNGKADYRRVFLVRQAGEANVTWHLAYQSKKWWQAGRHHGSYRLLELKSCDLSIGALALNSGRFNHGSHQTMFMAMPGLCFHLEAANRSFEFVCQDGATAAVWLHALTDKVQSVKTLH